MRAFPDMVVKLDGLSQGGDETIFRWLWTGTNTGPGGPASRSGSRGTRSGPSAPMA